MNKLWIVLSTLLIANPPGEQVQTFQLPKNQIVLQINNLSEFKQCSRELPQNINKFEAVKELELKILLKRMKQIYSLTESIRGKARYKLDSLDGYGFQYIGLMIKGRKYIYCNAFKLENRSDFLENPYQFKSQMINVCDGGRDYWGVMFDIKNRQFMNLVFNGGG